MLAGFFNVWKYSMYTVFCKYFSKRNAWEDDKNIAAEYSDLELVTDLKSQSGKPI